MRGSAVFGALFSRRRGAPTFGWVSSASRISSSSNLISTPNRNPSPNWKLFFSTTTTTTNSSFAPADNSAFHLPNQFRRQLCSSSTGPSNILYINSDQEFNKIMNDVRGKSSDAIFYFTAVWCGPCRFISPIITELSKQLPHVTTYKIDIDQESVFNTLRNFQVSAVPTLFFFHNGKMASQMIGADIGRLKETMYELYRDD